MKKGIISTLVWLGCTVCVYVWILFGTRERGTGMGGALIFAFTFWIGAFCVLSLVIGLIVKLVEPSRIEGSFRWPVLIAISCFGFYPVHVVGKSMLLADQEEAKQFIDAQLASFNGNPPSTAARFFADKPLPRMLRERVYYRVEVDGSYEISFSWDFDDSWRKTSFRPGEWVRGS